MGCKLHIALLFVHFLRDPVDNVIIVISVTKMLLAVAVTLVDISREEFDVADKTFD